MKNETIEEPKPDLNKLFNDLCNIEIEGFASVRGATINDRAAIANRLVRKYGESRKYKTCLLSTGTMYVFRTL